ncbi:hypothetical protein C8A05DRAFT_39749, partial [Staphylotrichum tortipilum]
MADNSSQDTDPPFPLDRAVPASPPTPIPDTPLIIIFLVLFTIALLLALFAHHLDRTRLKRDQQHQLPYDSQQAPQDDTLQAP